MIDDRIVELVNRDIDGLTSPEEHVRIEALRASNGEVRRLYEGLSGLSRTLAPPELVDPPPSLKSAIMRGVESRPQSRPHRAILDQAKLFVWREWNWQTGIGFAAGLALGVLVVALLLGSSRDSTFKENELVGTILLQGPTDPFREGETLGITRGETQGEIRTSFSRNLCLVRLSLRSSTGTRSELSYDASAVRMSALVPSASASSPIEVQNGRIALGADFNDSMMVIFAVHGAGRPALQLKITDAGGGVVERSVALVAPGGE